MGLCSCGTGMESTENFLLKCPSYSEPQKEVLTTNPLIEPELPSVHALDSTSLTEIYGHKCLNPSENKRLLSTTIEYIRKPGRFN